MNVILLIVLVIQIAMMIGGVIFLIETRKTIAPRSVWWAFLVNDLLWLILIVDGIAILSGYSVLGIEVEVLVTLVISSLFLFRLVMRYRAHKQKLLLSEEQMQMVQEWEDLRNEDEARHGHNWDQLTRFGFDIGQTVYHVNRSNEVKRDR